MIIAFVYGEGYGEKGVVCLDGVIIEGEEKKRVEKLFCMKINHIKNISDDKQIFVLNDRELLCQIPHNKKDNIGRVRMVQVCYDYFNDIANMEKVASVIGFNYKDFCQINDENTLKIRIGFLFYRIKKMICLFLKFFRK